MGFGQKVNKDAAIENRCLPNKIRLLSFFFFIWDGKELTGTILSTIELSFVDHETYNPKIE